MDTPAYPATLQLTVCTLDLVRGLVERDGELTKLTSRERDLLRYLAARPNEVVTRQELLQVVWGYSEKVVSRAVDKTVNRLRARIEQVRAQPHHLLTEYGVGFRLVLGAAGPVHGPPVTGPELGITERPESLNNLREALSREQLITVVGPGGLGKTHLVKALLPDAPRLDGSTLTAAELAHALEQTQGTNWQVLECAEAHVGVLRQTLPRLLARGALRLVVTSLRPIHLQGEWLYPLEALSQQASAELLQRRARRLVRDWGKGEESTISALATLSGGWPLAIEHMAHHARVLTPEAMLARGLPKGRQTDAGLAERHESLEACLERSVALLDEVDRDTASALSVFRAPQTLEAIQAVLDRPDWLENLSRLSTWGLVSVSKDTRVARLELFGPLREILAKRLRSDENQARYDALSDRHMHYFSQQAAGSHLVPVRERDTALYRRLRAGRLDLAGGFKRALETGRPKLALNFAYPLLAALLAERDVSAMEWVLDRLETCGAHIDDTLSLTMQLRRARSIGLKGDYSAAEEMVLSIKEEALRKQLAEPLVEACHCLFLFRSWGYRPGVREALEMGLAAAREHNLMTSIFLTELGWHHTDFCHHPGRSVQAESYLHKAAKAAMAEGAQMMEGMAYFGQATLAHQTGDQGRAIHCLNKAIPVVAEMGRAMGDLWELRGRIALADAKPDQAVQALRLALRARLQAGFRQARTRAYLAQALLADGQQTQAMHEVLAAERLARQKDDSAVLEVLYHRVHIDLAQPNAVSAGAVLEEANAAYTERAARIGEVTRFFLLKRAAEQAMAKFPTY